jgi:hypothetical protein
MKNWRLRSCELGTIKMSARVTFRSLITKSLRSSREEESPQVHQNSMSLQVKEMVEGSLSRSRSSPSRCLAASPGRQPWPPALAASPGRQP